MFLCLVGACQPFLLGGKISEKHTYVFLSFLCFFLPMQSLRPMLAAYQNFFSLFFDFDVCRFCTSKRRFGYFRLQLAMQVLGGDLVRD